jgi:hypothetical protein
MPPRRTARIRRRSSVQENEHHARQKHLRELADQERMLTVMDSAAGSQPNVPRHHQYEPRLLDRIMSFVLPAVSAQVETHDGSLCLYDADPAHLAYCVEHTDAWIGSLLHQQLVSVRPVLPAGIPSAHVKNWYFKVGGVTLSNSNSGWSAEASVAHSQTNEWIRNHRITMAQARHIVRIQAHADRLIRLTLVVDGHVWPTVEGPAHRPGSMIRMAHKTPFEIVNTKGKRVLPVFAGQWELSATGQETVVEILIRSGRVSRVKESDLLV